MEEGYNQYPPSSQPYRVQLYQSPMAVAGGCHLQEVQIYVGILFEQRK